MPQDPEVEDRERLERFLEWRRGDDESRKAARRHTVGMATLAVTVATLITASAWYVIDGHRRVALTPTAAPDGRVALAPGVDTDSNPKRVSPAAPMPLSHPQLGRGDSGVAASSAQASPPEAPSADARSTPRERTPAEATPAPAEATSSLNTSATRPMPALPLVAQPRPAARRESPEPRRSARVVREAGRVPAAATTPDAAASRPPEPAPIAATPVAPASPAVVPDTSRATMPPANAESVRSQPSTLVAAPPSVVPDTPRATVPSANAESVRSEPSTPVAAPPISGSPATRTEDAAAAVSRPTGAQTGSSQSGAAASVAESPARLAPPPPSTAQMLKEWAGYIPEVRMARAIYRWAKKQPPADGIRPEEPPPPQAR